MTMKNRKLQLKIKLGVLCVWTPHSPPAIFPCSPSLLFTAVHLRVCILLTFAHTMGSVKGLTHRHPAFIPP